MTRQRLIIGLTGKHGNTQAQAGKDTAAQHLVDKHHFTQMALADAVRDASLGINPWIPTMDPEQPLQRLADVVAALGWDDAKKLPEVRRTMQRVGTEGGRDIHGDHLWTEYLERRIASMPDSDIVISDIRFDNEAKWVRSLGGVVVRIERPASVDMLADETNKTHRSEHMIAERYLDYVVSNHSDIAQLHTRMDALLMLLRK